MCSRSGENCSFHAAIPLNFSFARLFCFRDFFDLHAIQIARVTLDTGSCPVVSPETRKRWEQVRVARNEGDGGKAASLLGIGIRYFLTDLPAAELEVFVFAARSTRRLRICQLSCCTIMRCSGLLSSATQTFFSCFMHDGTEPKRKGK